MSHESETTQNIGDARACSVAFAYPLFYLLLLYLVSTLGVQSKAQQVFLPRKIAGSRRVLATAVDDCTGKTYCVSS